MTKQQSTISKFATRQSIAHRNDALLFLEYLWRLEYPVRERSAVHIRFSHLRPEFRRPHHLRVALGMLREAFQPSSSQVFVLVDGDIVVVFPSSNRIAAEKIIQKVHHLFQDDLPMAVSGGTAGMAAWYDFVDDIGEILRVAANGALIPEERRSTPSFAPVALPTEYPSSESGTQPPFSQEKLSRLLRSVEQIDLSNLLRRQFVCCVSDRIVSLPRLVEHYVGVSDLGEALLPGVKIDSNPWLFQRFKVALDEKIFQSLVWRSRYCQGFTNSINITIETIGTKFFLDILSRELIFPCKNILFEFDQADVFTDFSSFSSACRVLRQHQHQVCLDGLTDDIFRIIDPCELRVDFVKVMWSRELRSSSESVRRRLQGLVRQMGEDRVALTRVDCEEAVKFGSELGMRLFQGRLVDRRLEFRMQRQRFFHGRLANDLLE